MKNILILFTILYSCISKNGNHVEDSFISIDNYFNLSDSTVLEIELNRDITLPNSIEPIMDSIIVTKLKTEILLNTIEYVRYFEKFFIVVDKNNLIKFDVNESQELFSLKGTKGKGPGEFQQISNVHIDTLKNKIIIIDLGLRKLVSFSLMDGEYQEENQLNFNWPTLFCIPINDTLLLHTTSNINFNNEDLLYNLITTNMKGDIFSRNLRIPEMWKNLFYNRSSLIPSYDHTFSFSSAYNNTIYSIDPYNNTINPLLKFDFGKYNIDVKKLNIKNKIENSTDILNNTNELIRFIDHNNYLLGPTAALESSDHILFQCYYKSKKNWGLYSKRTNNCIFSIEYNYRNTISSMYTHPVGVTNKGFIFVLYPHELQTELKMIESALDYDEFQNYKAMNNHLFEIMNNMNINSNPLLLTVIFNAF